VLPMLTLVIESGTRYALQNGDQPKERHQWPNMTHTLAMNQEHLTHTPKLRE